MALWQRQDRIGTDTSLAFVQRISPMGRLPEDVERTGAGATGACRRARARSGAFLSFGPEMTCFRCESQSISLAQGDELFFLKGSLWGLEMLYAPGRQYTGLGQSSRRVSLAPVFSASLSGASLLGESLWTARLAAPLGVNCIR